jgi:APA family basic amino acid/polyamine antiporter
MIVVLALVNHFGAATGAGLQNLSTFAKLAALAAIVLGGFASTPAAPAVAASAPAMPDLTAGLVVAAMAIFWAYEGWYQLPFNAAELRQPERTLPRGLILGTLILVVVYVSVNAAYVRVVPLAEMRTLARDIDVPLLAIQRMLGGSAGDALALLLCLSAFGAANPCLLSTPRAFYAMAQDGLWFRAMMRVHPAWRTPTIAIWSQALWSVALVVVLERFRDITEFVIFAALLFYALTVAAVFVLRRRMPERPRLLLLGLSLDAGALHPGRRARRRAHADGSGEPQELAARTPDPRRRRRGLRRGSASSS